MNPQNRVVQSGEMRGSVLLDRGTSLDDAAQEARDMAEAKRIGDHLFKVFPNHPWAVSVDTRQNWFSIRHLHLSDRYGYSQKVSNLYGDPDLKCVTRAAGEILERFNIKRGLADFDAIDSLQTRVGITKGDYSNMPNNDKAPSVWSATQDAINKQAAQRIATLSSTRLYSK